MARLQNICLVAEEFPPETGWGGIGTYHYTYARGLTALGCQVVVLARALRHESVETKDGIVIYRVLPCLRRAPHLLDAFAYRLRVARFLSCLIKRHSIQLVESPEWKAETLLFQKSHSRPPLFVRMHSPLRVVAASRGDERLSLAERRQCHLEYQLLRSADYVTSSSQSLVVETRKRGTLTRSIDAIGNPANNIDFYPAPPNSIRERFASFGRIVLYVGRMEHRKGVQQLLRAVPLIRARHPSTLFLLVGRDTPTGPKGSSYLQHVLRECDLLGAPYIHHEGFVEYLRLRDYYNLADLVVLPSLYDNFPATCLEALSCGRPVLGTVLGGMREIIEDGVSGVLCDPRNVCELSDKATLLLSDVSLASRIKEHALRAIAERFDRVVASRRILARYSEVLGLQT